MNIFAPFGAKKNGNYATMPDGEILNLDEITGFSVSGSTITITRTSDSVGSYTFTPSNASPDFIIRQLDAIAREVQTSRQVIDEAANALTFAGASANPAPFTGGTIIVTGTGFDLIMGEPATVECPFYPLEKLAVKIIDATHFSFDYPNLTPFYYEFPIAKNVDFTFVFNGNSVPLGFSIVFQ